MNRLPFTVSEPPRVVESARARRWRLWSERLTIFALSLVAALALFNFLRLA